MIHYLKIHPEPFALVKSGAKPYEVRVDDRNFAVGDTLILEEFDPQSASYSGEKIARRVSCKTSGGQWGLPDNLCVLGLCDDDHAGELARLRARIAQLEPFEPRLLSLDGEGSRLSVAHDFMKGCIAAFEELNGEANYTETRFDLPPRQEELEVEFSPSLQSGGGHCWFVTVRRGDKPTPHQLRRASEELLAQTRAELERFKAPAEESEIQWLEKIGTSNDIEYLRAEAMGNLNARVFLETICEKRDAAIFALEAELAALREQNRWRPLPDGPEETQK